VILKKVIDTLRKDKVTTYIVNIICQVIENIEIIMQQCSKMLDRL